MQVVNSTFLLDEHRINIKRDHLESVSACVCLCCAKKNLKKLNKGHRQVFNSAAHILNENA